MILDFYFFTDPEILSSTVSSKSIFTSSPLYAFQARYPDPIKYIGTINFPKNEPANRIPEIIAATAIIAE